MKYSELVSKLEKKFILTDIQIHQDNEINTIQIGNGTQPHTLYIEQAVAGPLKLVSCADHACVRCPCISQTSTNLSNQAVVALFNDANEVLAAEQQQEALFSGILQYSLTHDHQAVIDFAATQLNNTLMIIDDNYRVLAYSHTFPFPDPLWQQNIDQGYSRLDFIQGIKKMLAQTKPSAQASYRFPCPVSPYQRLVARLYFQHELVGYVVMFNDQQDFTVAQQQLLPRTGQVLSDLLGRAAAFKDYQVSVRAQLLSDLLEGINVNAIKVNAQIVGYTVPQSMCLVVLKAADQLARLCQKMRERFPEALVVVYQERVVALLPGSLPTLKKITWSDLQQQLQCQVIVSNCYHDFFATKAQYIITRHTEKLSLQLQDQAQLLFCRDYYFAIMLDRIKQRDVLTAFIDPGVQQLQQYDLANQTELIMTLAQYIRCGGNQTITAERLFIHRNTLLNRLHKIEDLTGLDLKDSQLWFQLECSLQMQRLLASLNR
ncbi:PucR family transcriptional regulator [Loigolactobacillus coryniformis]|uniref:Transcriptional regulator n=1 Tax=Loigolactobacillus coryniformis subsp. torquens DSM 20004 = KCTC 3535 TaxID=1423822 RepID=A0A2D1KK60_9LACO|nr:helix-turn-helix domain-containing protein [Loigolactobacillus coryniformis]ATO42510.1 transcriptional regulator [Loigolactobacillus coryniformis subsp. torquens DSM 20004 = KCTC 3535]KRK84661.1 transcriptional regulator, CdaR [Loigolactobacillus coryniformis subsp. torquens DSM 20004 = KCTC 3535]